MDRNTEVPFLTHSVVTVDGYQENIGCLD